jgi:hypothetical protein
VPHQEFLYEAYLSHVAQGPNALPTGAVAGSDAGGHCEPLIFRCLRGTGTERWPRPRRRRPRRPEGGREGLREPPFDAAGRHAEDLRGERAGAVRRASPRGPRRALRPAGRGGWSARRGHSRGRAGRTDWAVPPASARYRSSPDAPTDVLSPVPVTPGRAEACVPGGDGRARTAAVARPSTTP